MTWVTAAVMRALVLTLFWIALAGWSADYAVYGGHQRDAHDRQ